MHISVHIRCRGACYLHYKPSSVHTHTHTHTHPFFKREIALGGLQVGEFDAHTSSCLVKVKIFLLVCLYHCILIDFSSFSSSSSPPPSSLSTLLSLLPPSLSLFVPLLSCSLQYTPCYFLYHSSSDRNKSHKGDPSKVYDHVFSTEPITNMNVPVSDRCQRVNCTLLIDPLFRPPMPLHS